MYGNPDAKKKIPPPETQRVFEIWDDHTIPNYSIFNFKMVKASTLGCVQHNAQLNFEDWMVKLF